MKCKHNKCNRELNVQNKSGFCNKCIQLNTMECNFCETKEKEKIIKCPKCKVNMGKMSNGRYVIDKCPKCKSKLKFLRLPQKDVIVCDNCDYRSILPKEK